MACYCSCWFQVVWPFYIVAVKFSYNYFRDYDPQTGRYVESDSIGLAGGSFSTFAYVGGSPLSKIDPEGLAGGNAAQRRGARRAQPPGPAQPSTNDSSSLDGLPDAVIPNICMFTKQGCLDPDLFLCDTLECTPKCGKKYRKSRTQNFTSVEDPDTTCTCIDKSSNTPNPTYDKPLPGY